MRILRTLIAVAAAYPLVASAGILNSKHDLASTSTTTGPKATTETNTCKFCHTPHGAQTFTALWNHAATANNAFTWGGLTTTSAGTTLPTTQATMKNGTLRCLGCHDGSVGIGDLAVGADITMNATALGASATIGASGNFGAAAAANHPISIPYLGATGSALNAATFPGNGYFASGACANSSGFCPNNVVGVTLYGTATNNLSVECSSCHEPHNNANGKFLRMSNAGGALCKACHNK